MPVKRGWDEECLNCGTDLHGSFCSSCGQRAIPPDPTVAEMLGDTWRELSGYDGRFVQTFLLLLRRPGALTLEFLAGRRVRFIAPLRLYLVASLAYFLLAAAIPNVQQPRTAQLPGSRVTIDLTDPDRGGLHALTPEQQKEILGNIERAPWLLRPILRTILTKPAEFRRGFLEVMARVLFVLVPVFAAIVALFYRRRPFSQHVVFALHLHATIFLSLTAAQLGHLSGRQTVVDIFSVVAAVWIAAYALRAFHRVYQEGWPWIVAKGLGIACLYLAAGIFGLVVGVAWAALSAA
jgi:hypothetical protein